jgi:hypothetical protein
VSQIRADETRADELAITAVELALVSSPAQGLQDSGAPRLRVSLVLLEDEPELLADELGARNAALAGGPCGPRLRRGDNNMGRSLSRAG